MRSVRSDDREDKLDNAIELMSSSISKICEQRENTRPSTQTSDSALKFHQFYASLDEVLVQIPYVEALRFNLDCMERVNALRDKIVQDKSQ